MSNTLIFHDVIDRGGRLHNAEGETRNYAFEKVRAYRSGKSVVVGIELFTADSNQAGVSSESYARLTPDEARLLISCIEKAILEMEVAS